VRRNGRSRHGKQRWLCRHCGHTFGWTNQQIKYHQLRIWFERWIVEGYTFRQLAYQSGHSLSTIRRVVGYWLQRPPAFTTTLSSVQYFIFDGTFFERRRGVFAVMDAERFAIVHAEANTSEGPTDMQCLCDNLGRRGIMPKSATVDGNPHLIRVLRRRWPSIIIQRCLVHIQRQGLSWCRRFPKRKDAKHLRFLFLRVMTIQTFDDRAEFLAAVRTWEHRYGQHVGRSPETGWVFSDLKRARSMLLAALPDMFHYLDDAHIQRSTNALEGYFSRLKQRYRQHRGLAPHHRDAYFRWFIHLCPR
jgi:hypothetical protein